MSPESVVMKFCQLLAVGQWLSKGFIDKTNRHDMWQLKYCSKVALNTCIYYR
jgi:hypothetical protein